MKKLLLALVFVTLVGSGFAAAGAPQDHGLSGKEFGEAVSGLEPGAISMHVASPNKGGLPALHGVDGMTFGELVSALAQSLPGAVADHIGV